MTASKTTRKRSEVPRLTRDDWLDAAFRAVVEGGFDSARVLSLAETLGVTRGSFYWHFEDHAALIAALLERWRQRETDIGQDERTQATEDPVADLDRLLEAALSHVGPNLENMRFELALRGMGRRDAAVANMLVEVDAARMELFQKKFERLTGDATTATELASLFYLAIVGSNQALSRPASPPRLKEYLKSIITTYLIHQPVHYRRVQQVGPGA